MKKTFVVVATVVFFVALGLSSCKSTSDCPAYSKVNIEKNVKNA
jgi:hypothetical protein